MYETYFGLFQYHYFNQYFSSFALQNPQFEYRISTQNSCYVISIQAASFGVEVKTIQRQRVVGGSIPHRDYSTYCRSLEEEFVVDALEENFDGTLLNKMCNSRQCMEFGEF